MKKFIVTAVIVGLCLSIIGCGKKEKQKVYFDATDCAGMTEEEMMETLGNADSVEDWVYNNQYIMRTYTYGKREYTYVQDTTGVFQLARVTLYEDIPYTDKNTLYELFNMGKTQVNDNGTVINMSYIANAVKDIDIQDYDEQHLKWTQITYISGLF